MPDSRPPSTWAVHKFGGTSVANADRYRRVQQIVEAEPGTTKAIVVSAMSGVTDVLHGLVDRARARDLAWHSQLEALRDRHHAAIRDLLPEGPARDVLLARIDADIADLGDVLRTVQLGRACSEQLLELVAGYGEIWSAQVLGASMAATASSAGSGLRVQWLDARDVLTVVPAEMGPEIQWNRSRAQLHAWLAEHPCDRLVITGYVASTPEGVPTTLKRNGSDFSAAIFGALLDAPEITIWTDVDGVLSADPRRVPEAVVLPEMSYDEAIELAYFGAKVLHPRTMVPAVERGIPILIRNTLRPEAPGTRIHRRPVGGATVDAGHAVTGLSTFDGIALVNVEGSGMVGVPGVAERLFGALRAVGVSVIMISQASSEHSICFAVPEAQAVRARDAVSRAFPEKGVVERVDVMSECSILAAVGDRMAETPGVAARFFEALARTGVNVRAIAQGSSERNISVVIDRKDSTRALRAVHAGFYLSGRTISLGIMGPGQVGRALLRQVLAQADVLRETLHVDLRLRAIGNRTRMLLGEPWLQGDADELLRRLGDEGFNMDQDRFAEHMASEHLPHNVIVDCSAADAVADRYAGWMSRGIHVVTPNKRAGAGDPARWRALKQLERTRGAQWLFEATVGAGLPVISTLRDLVRTGDRIVAIEGILSGTLAFVFHRFGGDRSFSSVVREARALGYTEPDPRDDLSGMDVARKCVILAREIGMDVGLPDVQVQDLSPAEARGAEGADAFLSALSVADASMDALRAEAAAAGEVLRYVGTVRPGEGCSASLRRLPANHPLALASGTENVIAFTTERYRTSPLIVQGPGAGPDVTAAGIFADLLRLVSGLGARG